MSKLLALDMSGFVGHAFMVPGRKPITDTWKAPPEEAGRYGARATKLRSHLVDLIATFGPDAMAAEAPLIPNSYKHMDTTTDTVLFLSGIVFIAEQVADEYGLRFLRVHHDDAKMALLGRSNGVKKIEMVGKCLGEGWKVASEHEADAIGVGLHAFEVLWPGLLTKISA
ncbi:MAG: hypothetical protein K9G48_13880 [Reyranella sp.]|nr:hypothetical protein [Reyranella sp.]